MNAGGFMRSCLFLTICVGLVACNYHTNKAGDPKATNVDTLPGSMTIDWQLMQTQALQVCMQCHAGRQNPNLSTYEQMKSQLDLVANEIESQEMPPKSSGLSPLSPCRSAVFRKWRELGAPETSTVTVATVSECPQQTTKGTPIDQMPLNYQTLLTQILQPRCVQCHNPGDDSDASQILFTPYANLIKGGRWTSPAAQSKVVQLLRSTNLDERMPPPEAGDALPEDQIRFIERWINAGNPEF